jgi:UDP-N-acetyl-2-amino-2-deoxyglucuronate dehydrogenase
MDGAGLRFSVVLQHRFRAASRQLAKLVRDGELGRLVSGSASIRWWRPPEYFAQAGAGDEGPRRRRRAPDPGDPQSRPVPKPDGPGRGVAAMAATSPLRRIGIDSEDVAAAVAFVSGAIGGRRDHRCLSRPSRAHRARLREGDRDPARRKFRGALEGWPHPLPKGQPSGRRRRGPNGILLRGPQGRDHGLSRRHRPRSGSDGREATRFHVLIEAILQSAAEGRVVNVKQPW